MDINNRVSTGLGGFDKVIDMLRLGDNVVWQVQSVDDYRRIVEPYIRKSREDGRRLVYFRFGGHDALMDGGIADAVYTMNAQEGFESFATKIHNIIEAEGPEVFYVFDCLTDLLQFWYSDLIIGNFFRVTCPFLYSLDTVAYFGVIRNAHTYDTIARIRETTQVLLDLYRIDEQIYIHPLKVWERYSPIMFFPHLVRGDEAVSITASTEAAELFSNMDWNRQAQDYWEVTVERAREAKGGGEAEREAAKELLMTLIIGRDPKMQALCARYFTLRDMLNIADREIGSGFIGGKSVGMLLARKILKTEAWDALKDNWEPHDSYYIGSDVFYTYIVQNGWWELRTKQKTPEGYFTQAHTLQKNLLEGKFPEMLREQFVRMLEHFGQSPIIVRSSSLLEDNYGNAFAGKYDSVFCANQGSPQDRLQTFEAAVRAVYASTMNQDALAYRMNRGLVDKDEQMAILVQRVSGDHHGDYFFPHIAGVGNSSNLYVWDRDMDPSAGMLRLVFGLGTRAVDRVSGDYARLVPLDNPKRLPPVNHGDERKFSQHKVDVLNLRENRHTGIPVETVTGIGIKTDKAMFFSVDYAALRRLQERGRGGAPTPLLLDFKKLLEESPFPALASTVLQTLQGAYEYPVDIEYSANFTRDNSLKFNLLQCRPLQTKGLGKAVEMPKPESSDVFFSTRGSFMGGNVRLPLDYVVFVRAGEYLALPEQEKYGVARLVGRLNLRLRGEHCLLAGPGRWGTTTPSLGVPVHFTELCHMDAICEVAYREGGLLPELSYGSHFFQDIVESDIFYAAVFDGDDGVAFRPEMVLQSPNLLGELLPGDAEYAHVVHLAATPGLTLCSDILTQTLICCAPKIR